MKRFGAALLGVGACILLISVALSTSPADPGWSSFFLKARLTEALEKRGYLVVWERRDRAALSPHLERIMRAGISSPADVQALRKLTAEGLRIAASGAIHFIEIEGAGAGVIIGLFERPYHDSASDGAQTPPERSLRYSPLLHWHEGKEFFMHQWIRMDTGLRYETLPDFLPLEEMSTLSATMSGKEKRVLFWTQLLCFILAVSGTCILLRRGIRDISQRAWRRCAAILTFPLPPQPHSAGSALVKTPAHKDATRRSGTSPISLIGHAPATKPGREEDAVPRIKPPHKETERILREITVLHEDEGDPDRKKALGEIRVALASVNNQSIGAAQFYLWRARKIASSREKQDASFAETKEAERYYERYRALLPVENFIPKHLDPVCVQNVLLMFLAPGTNASRFGDHPLGYVVLKKPLLRRGMQPEALEQCLSWLDKIRVIVDIKGGYEIRRKRAKGMRRYSINARCDNVRYPADEIIRLMILADQKIKSFSAGKG